MLCHPVQSKASSDLSPVKEVPRPGVLRGGDPDHVVAGVHPLRLAVPAQVEVRADAALVAEPGGLLLAAVAHHAAVDLPGGVGGLVGGGLIVGIGVALRGKNKPMYFLGISILS